MTRELPAYLIALVAFTGCVKDAPLPSTSTIEIDAESGNVFIPGMAERTEANAGWGDSEGLRLWCGRCRKEGLKSSVHRGGCMTTLVACADYYDEDGNWVVDDCNTSTCNYTCSQGHWWSGSW